MRTISISENNLNDLFKRLSYKHQLILRVAIATGLRISDVISIKVKQVNQQSFTIVEQKTQKKRKITLKKMLKRDLIEFSKESINDFVFCSSTSSSGHITRQAVYKQIKNFANIKHWKNISPHSYRKTYAHNLLTKKSIFEVQKKLNHEHISDTMLYIVDLN